MSVPPGSTIGIIGGGQLGRMLAVAAAQLGYRTHIYAPEASGPAADVSARWVQGAYDDAHALLDFAEGVDAITYEFENIWPGAIAKLSAERRTRPLALSLDIARNRLHEKSFAARHGGTTAAYRPVTDLGELRRAAADLGGPSILKTLMFGYDGKGQARLNGPEDAAAAWSAIGAPAPTADFPGPQAILERRVDFFAEFSVILCRTDDGETAVWDAPENTHKQGILDTSTVPGRHEVLALVPDAVGLSRRIADALGHVGVLTCEFFATADGPIFNEMAPRVHNSGHWTIEGAVTSQFENHIRAVCGLPLGSTALTAPRAEMRNLIGADADGWREILADPTAHLHLYGKETRPGRKMGHVTRLFQND
ncbi:5-(carboxyamino)imidazole ribonucleotide synthase [Allosphingosinicella sp.]|uniref:5-(carboxyamino)imidazole ribonucleotide synthase n=1 Tax=Allosphingosinicella sp. TaxID=2823234 RepID=UPI00378515F9